MNGGGRAGPARGHWGLFFLVVLAPGALVAVTTVSSFERAKSVAFCSSCHVMGPYVSDLEDPKSAGLAAKHHQKRWINRDQCYACHSDYDVLGPLGDKWRGLRHLASYYSGAKRPPKLHRLFPNAPCLDCHDGSRPFVGRAAHGPVLGAVRSGERSCFSCHEAAHALAREVP